MAKKSNSQKDIQGLITFKTRGSLSSKEFDNYKVEKRSQEDKITVQNSLTTKGIHYRFSLRLNNTSSLSIADIKIEIFYPRILKFTGSYPAKLTVNNIIKKNQDKNNILNLNLKGIEGKNSEEIHLHFAPSTQLGTGEFTTFFKYVNNEGKEREIKSPPIEIHIDDLKITPKIISHSRIREISQLPGMKRALISLGIGKKKKLNQKKIFDMLENLVESYNFQFITKDEEKGILWFFGTESKSSYDILALSKIGLNFIEIIAYSINPIILGLFLYSFKKNIKEKLLINRIIKSNVKIFDLECFNCGEVLPYFPKIGESITCIKCSHEQIIW